MKLRVGAVYRDAALTYRTRPARVLGTATIIFVPITSVQVVLADLGRHDDPHAAWAVILYVAGLVSLTAVGTFETSF